MGRGQSSRCGNSPQSLSSAVGSAASVVDLNCDDRQAGRQAESAAMFVFGLCISLSPSLALSVFLPPAPLFDCVNGNAVGYVFAASAPTTASTELCTLVWQLQWNDYGLRLRLRAGSQ